jgi:hypothetical protein
MLNHKNLSGLKYSKIDYLIIFLVLITSVNPFFTGSRFVQFGVFILVTFRMLFLRRQFFINRKIVFIFIIYAVISVVQGLIWSFSLFTLFSGFITAFMYAYFLYRTYSYNIFGFVERVIFHLTILSLTIYLLQETLPYFSDTLYRLVVVLDHYSTDVNRHLRALIIYTYRPESKTIFDITRNSGFAHEPGGFAVFINFGLIINYLRGTPLFSKRNIVYFIALISTFSTAGFLSTFVLFNLILNNNKNRILSGFYYVVLMVFVVNFVLQSEIMADKIQSQFLNQTSIGLDSETTGRFMGARKSLYVISKYPLHGRGLQASSMPDSWLDPEYASYGWLSYISKIGLIFGVLFLYFFIKGIYYWVKISGFNNKVFIIVTISMFISFSSQVYITQPFFLSFLFLGLFQKYRLHEYSYKSILLAKPQIFFDK